MTEALPPPQPRAPGEDSRADSHGLPHRWRARLCVAAAAALVGLVGGLPHLLISSRLRAEGKRYAPLVAREADPVVFDELSSYAVRIRDVLDGHPLSADAFTWEHRNDVPYYGQAMLDSLLVAPLALAVGGSVPNLYILCSFLLPPLLVVLLVVLCRRLGAPYWVGIAAAVTVVIAHDLVTLPITFARRPSVALLADVLHLLHNDRPLEFSRLTVPAVTWLVGFGAILALLAVYDQPRWWRALIAGVLFGCTFYCYSFLWSWLLVGGCLLVLACAILKSQRRALPLLAGALAMGLLLGSPVIYQALAPNGYSGKAELIVRYSGQGQSVNWANQKHDLALLALILILYPRRRREFVPLMCFLVAPFLCIEGSRVIGLNLQDYHWLGRCWQPWSALTLVLMLGAWIQELSARRRAGAGAGARAALGFGALTLLVLVYGTNAQWRFCQDWYRVFSLPLGYQEALDGLMLRAPADSVVLSLDSNTLALIPVYTRCRVYLPYCTMSPASTEELEDRAALTCAAYGVSDAGISDLLAWGTHDNEQVRAHDQSNLSNWLFHHTLRGSGTPPEAEARIKAKAHLYGPLALREYLHKYRADFLWWGPVARRYGDPAVEKSLASNLFLDAGEVKVYRVPEG